VRVVHCNQQLWSTSEQIWILSRSGEVLSYRPYYKADSQFRRTRQPSWSDLCSEPLDLHPQPNCVCCPLDRQWMASWHLPYQATGLSIHHQVLVLVIRHIRSSPCNWRFKARRSSDVWIWKFPGSQLNSNWASKYRVRIHLLHLYSWASCFSDCRSHWQTWLDPSPQCSKWRSLTWTLTWRPVAKCVNCPKRTNLNSKSPARRFDKIYLPLEWRPFQLDSK
jgi:hypothetical protein